MPPKASIASTLRSACGLWLAAALLLLQTASLFSATYFMATNGLYTNSRASNSPFATNKFDLAGNYAITNAIPTGVAQQFYRVSLP